MDLVTVTITKEHPVGHQRKKFVTSSIGANVTWEVLANMIIGVKAVVNGVMEYIFTGTKVMVTITTMSR